MAEKSDARLIKAHAPNLGLWYSGPMTLWFTVFFLAPLLIILIYSFLKKDLFGGVTASFSFDAYRALANPKIALITGRTVVISIIATIITIIIALPCGYYMAQSRNQTFLLLLIIIPFWTNFMIRVFAWMNILGNDGFINLFLLRVGFIQEPIHLLFNKYAVILVLIYMYLPYAILPLFSSIDKFDFSLLEAARDLGATKVQAIFKVLFPNIRGGIFTAVLFTFIPMFGAYAVPMLVGDIESYMLGNAVADYIGRARNLPLASAISMVLTAITTIGILCILATQRKGVRKQEVKQ
ncbi:MAG: ABC transporter permease [Spirochaetaceae bacterium]|jgi:spermidine/putrescine transport system permease protein|nr:ABC transporter permease [Spirochaetaceae bacterium]